MLICSWNGDRQINHFWSVIYQDFLRIIRTYQDLLRTYQDLSGLVQTSSQKLIQIQMKAFFCQTLMSFLIYGGTLIVLMIFINGESEALSLEINPEIILNNQKFNACVIVILMIGFFSLCLSWRGKTSAMLCCCDITDDSQR